MCKLSSSLVVRLVGCTTTGVPQGMTEVCLRRARALRCAACAGLQAWLCGWVHGMCWRVRRSQAGGNALRVRGMLWRVHIGVAHAGVCARRSQAGADVRVHSISATLCTGVARAGVCAQVWHVLACTRAGQGPEPQGPPQPTRRRQGDKGGAEERAAVKPREE